jgi:hypothetical protein
MIAAAKSMDINMSCLRRGVVIVPHGTSNSSSRRVCGVVRASMVDSYESSSDIAKRMEQAWLISQVKFKSFSFFLIGFSFFLFMNYRLGFLNFGNLILLALHEIW